MTTHPPPTLTDAAAFLAGHYGAASAGVAEIGRGEWSVAFGFRHEGRDLVVRFGREHDDFGKDRLAATYASAALPVPRVHEIGEAFGGYFAISDRILGGFLEHRDEAGMRATLPSLFAAFDAMRTADISATSGYGMWDQTGAARYATWPESLLALADHLPRVAGWREKLAATPAAQRAFDEAHGAMTALIAFVPDARHLLHSDTLNRNILVQDRRITGVIDWGCGMYGDFLYDIAYTDFWRPWYPDWSAVDIAAEAKQHYERIALDVPHFRERIRCYALHTGLLGCAYSAWMQRPDDLDAIARHMLALARLPL